jgi:hypothetical protein
LAQNNINENTQIKLEMFLFNQCSEYFDFKNKASKHPSVFNNKFASLLLEVREGLIKYLIIRKNIDSSKLKHKEDIILATILSETSLDKIVDTILLRVLIYINDRNKDMTHNSVVTITIDIYRVKPVLYLIYEYTKNIVLIDY